MILTFLIQVSGMVEDAQPLQALRNNCLRDRAIAGMARKNNVRQEQDRNTGRKRGRRCGTANSTLGRSSARLICTTETVYSQSKISVKFTDQERFQKCTEQFRLVHEVNTEGQGVVCSQQRKKVRRIVQQTSKRERH